MAKDNNKMVLLQARVDEKLASRIDEIAALLNMNRANFIECMLEFSLDDHEYVIRFINKFVMPIQKFMSRYKKKTNNEVLA